MTRSRNQDRSGVDLRSVTCVPLLITPSTVGLIELGFFSNHTEEIISIWPQKSGNE